MWFDPCCLSFPSMIRSTFLATLAASSLALLVGCATAQPERKQTTADHAGMISQELPSPPGPLPTLTAASSPEDFVRYALLNHPSVAAAWHDWRAAQAAVLPARSLPDPQLTFQADIASTVMSLMPGLMVELMSSGKRAAMGREAEAATALSRRQYASTLIKVATETRRALIELSFLDQAIALRSASFAVAEQSGQLAASEYAAGRGMNASLTAQVQAGDTAARLRSESESLNERRTAAHIRLKSSLGLQASEPDPAEPRSVLSATALPPDDVLWQRVQTTNPELATMRAMVEMAVAGVDVARRGGSPDFTVGLMTDVKQAPWMWRPTATMTLPIWRSKIHEAITAAQSRQEAAVARVAAEQLNLAAELAQMLAMIREADRMLAYIDSSALPSLRRTQATAEAGYRAGTAGATMIVEASGMELAMHTERLAALRERELAVVGLLAMTADAAPAWPSDVGPDRRADRGRGGASGPALPAGNEPTPSTL